MDGSYISGSCNFQDAGVNFTVYFSHTHMMKYMMFNAAPNTYHHIWGSIIVRAYFSRKFSRAAYSMKMSATKIGVAKISATKGIDLERVSYDLNVSSLEESIKFKFMLALFLVQRWDEQSSIVNVNIDFEKGDKVELARDILMMQQRLIAAGFMPEATPPVLTLQPVVVVGERRRRPGMILENELVVLNPELRAVTLEALKDPALLDSGVLPALVAIPANDPAPVV